MIYNISLIVFFAIVLTYSFNKKETVKLPHISNANLFKVTFNDLEGYDDDDLMLAFDVFTKDCKKAKRYKNLKEVCTKALNSTDSIQFFKNNFTPFALIGENDEEKGLITGYYEPLLHGSLKETEKYKYPIYKTPKNLLIVDMSSVYKNLKGMRLRGKVVGNKVVPYSSREDLEIKEKEHLEPICFVDNKVDLFFLQIQGSGKVKLENGDILNIGYAQQNGHPYYPIGRKLIEMGEISKKDISLQTIKAWLEANPSKMDEILNLNSSYVFFRNSSKTATGSLGTELVANRNLAVDRKYIPLGFPVFINTTDPVTKRPINQLMVAADTGGAIKGEIRADFFFGFGKDAENKAGKMKQKGKLYIFIPNNLI